VQDTKPQRSFQDQYYLADGCHSEMECHTEDQEDRRREGNAHVTGGCTEWEDKVDNPTVMCRLPPHAGLQGNRNKAVEVDNCLDRKSIDQDYDILLAVLAEVLLEVLVELHSLPRLPCEMENNGNVHGKESLEGRVEIAYQFRRNSALLPHGGAAFPDLAVLASLMLSTAGVPSRNIRDSTR